MDKRKMRHIFIWVILFTLLPLWTYPATEKEMDILFRALADELKRGIIELKIENQAKPYYIAYRIIDEKKLEIKAALGGLIKSDESKSRTLYVDVHVGDYQLDNSNFVCQVSGSRVIESDKVSLPIEDEYFSIRQRIWLVTDGTYKKALEKFARKKAYLENKQMVDTVADFASAQPCSILDKGIELIFDRDELNRGIIKLSRIFERFPEVIESAVNLKLKLRKQYFLDSEGGRNLRSDNIVGVDAWAKIKTIKGEVLEDFISFYGKTPDELDFLKIENAIAAWVDTLCQGKRLKEEEYSGPVLLLNQASAAFFFQVLGKGVSDVRPPVYESENLAGNMPKINCGFLVGKLGRKIAPQFIFAFDDPNLEYWNGIPLIGGFKIDEQGVRAERVDLIKDGKLQGLLMSRAPTNKIKGSNGHARYCEELYERRYIGFVGNLIIQSKEKKTTQELVSKLKELAREYGNSYALVITRLCSSTPKSEIERYSRFYRPKREVEPILSSPIICYKVDLETERMELIRGLDFSQTTPRVLHDIVATGDNEYVYNTIYYDDYGNEYPVSVIAPAILIKEMELTIKKMGIEKPPILPRPQR